MTGTPTTFKTFRVTVLEWLTHKAYIEAPDADTAKAIARDLWENGECHDGAGRYQFSFDDSGIDEIEVDVLDLP